MVFWGPKSFRDIRETGHWSLISGLPALGVCYAPRDVYNLYYVNELHLSVNGSFAAGDQMVQKPPHWATNGALGHPKQSN